MKQSRYLLAGLLGLGLLSSLFQPATPPLRQQLLEIRETYSRSGTRAQLNFKNQFTPGFKSRSQWGGPNDLVWTQGEIFKTQTPTNLAVNGVGCFGLHSEGKIAYTRDGRFSFQEGILRNNDGWSLLGMPVDTKGNIIGEAGSIRLDLDPNTNLYGGRYTGFHFDELGKLYGEATLVDPVTGQQVTASTPLFQVVLFQFPNFAGLQDQNGPTHNIWLASAQSGRAVSGLPGQGALGAICPGSLELSNVDFMQEGSTLQWVASHWKAFSSRGPASPVQQELLNALKGDSRLRQAALDNLTHALTPGYRSWDVLGYLHSGRLQRRTGPGTLMETHNPTDLALDGPACFVLSNGEWTRNGRLSWTEKGLTSQGGLIMGYAGDQLEPVKIPAEASNLEITARGEVRWTDLGGDGQSQTHYRLALADPQSGAHGKPGPAFGTHVCQGYLETPNGDKYEESLEAGALLELAGLPPFYTEELRQPETGQRPLPKLAF
ncbi:MAG: hypothetical protein KF760_26635 [Candidatus Eremiobacteraeota bacterium]|nr:hypothetical protein [Candidatus Eremiobacteraeota bacterium]MCW5871308.1 hypothetical protein [Candidatus Eremiobacteraeota bacterium]